MYRVSSYIEDIKEPKRRLEAIAYLFEKHQLPEELRNELEEHVLGMNMLDDLVTNFPLKVKKPRAKKVSVQTEVSPPNAVTPSETTVVSQEVSE